MAYSADGQLFAAGCEDGSVRFWEARSGKKAKEAFMTECDVSCIAFSPDNRRLASGHWDNNIRLWDLRDESAEPKARVLVGHTDQVWSVAFSSDGKRLISGSGDKTIRVWDAESGAAIGTPFAGPSEIVASTTFSDYIARTVSVRDESPVNFWSSETGKLVEKLLRQFLKPFAFSRDGRLIAASLGAHDGTIEIRDASTCEQVGDSLTNQNYLITSLCFSVDSRYLASGLTGNDHLIRIWRVETFLLICELRGHTDDIDGLAFSPDGRNLLSGSEDGTVRVWNVRVDPTLSFDQPSSTGNSFDLRTTCVSYVAGSNLIASGSEDGNIYLWDVCTGVEVRKTMLGHTESVGSLAVSSDGRWLVSGSDDETLRLWEVASGSALGEPMLGHTDSVNSVAISSDDKLIASASWDGTVRLWDAATQKLVMILQGQEGSVASVVFSVDGKKINSGSHDATFRIWDIETGKAVAKTLGSSVVAVAVSPDGQWIASSSYKGVLICDISTLDPEAVRVLQEYRVSNFIAFSPDSEYLISSSEFDAITIWNVRTGKAAGDLTYGYALECDVRSVAFHTNGHEFVSCHDDGNICVWDVHARTDLDLYEGGDIDLYEGGDIDYSGLGEEESRICWNASLSRMDEHDGWVRDGDKLLLWVPLKYRYEFQAGIKLVIGVPRVDRMIPQADYQKLFRYSGRRWTDIYDKK